MIKRRLKKINNFDLEMNSLLDILIIIVFFLIISYSATNLDPTLLNNISIPISKSIESPYDIMAIKVDKESNIWIDDILIKKELDESGEYYVALYNQLVQKDKNLELVSKGAGLERPNEIINLVIDRAVQYEIIKNIMNTAAKIGVTEFKFIVINED